MRFRRSLLFVSTFLLLQPAWAQAPISPKIDTPRVLKSYSADAREIDDRRRDSSRALRVTFSDSAR